MRKAISTSIFFGDDDTFINFKNLDSFLKNLSLEELVIYGNLQRMFRFQSLVDDMHLTGGPGIIMNRRTFLTVSEAIRRYYIKDIEFSDVSLALNIKKYNDNAPEKIKLMPAKYFIQDHKWLHESPPLRSNQFPKVITYHLRSWLDGKDSYQEILDTYNRLAVYDDDVRNLSRKWMGWRPRIWLNWRWSNATRTARRSRHERDHTESAGKRDHD